jgi:hypothetical protein
MVEKNNFVIRKKGKEGRPRHNEGLKILCSIRITEEIKKKIKFKYVSIQKWIDDKIKNEEL